MREGGKHNTNVKTTKILIDTIVDSLFDIYLIKKTFNSSQNQLLFKTELYYGEYNIM